MDVGPFRSVGCARHEFQVLPSFIAQFSPNPIDLSPLGSPARPPNSGDEVRFVLHEFQVLPSFIAQFSTNPLDLSPLDSPARPPNSGDEVRFVLHGSSLIW